MEQTKGNFVRVNYILHLFCWYTVLTGTVYVYYKSAFHAAADIHLLVFYIFKGSLSQSVPVLLYMYSMSQPFKMLKGTCNKACYM